MPDPHVTVVVPVGPYPDHQHWLDEALDSAKAQSYAGPMSILLIDDMANLWPDRPWTARNADGFWRPSSGPLAGCDIWYSPWRLGVAHAFNMGVALAKGDLVVMLGADDRLHPDAVAEAVVTWRAAREQDAYYWFSVEYMDEREEKYQYQPCGAAMVTKQLWHVTGGFAPETASGAPDAALISMMLIRAADRLVQVGQFPLYYYRPHPQSDTAERGPWQGVILETRGIVTERGFPSAWNRQGPV